MQSIETETEILKQKYLDLSPDICEFKTISMKMVN